jgi:uncharacterized membrane protein
MSTRALTGSLSVPAIRVRTWSISIWAIAVWAGAAVYSAVLTGESIADHHKFRTGLDTALYDQLLWLLAHGKDPFSTVVSRPMLGDHFQPGLVLYTPLHWLGLGIPGIYAAQSIALALTAPALYALARKCGASPVLASVPAFLWLVCPWVASANLFEFRPPALAPLLLVLSVIAVLERRNGLLAVTTLLALSLKEDVALTYLALGILIAYHGRRRAGALVGAASAAWFVLASWAVKASSGSYDLFGARFAGDHGHSVGSALLWELEHPLRELGDIATQSLPDLLLILLSTAGLPLLAPSWLLLAAPTAAHNALSAYSPQHDLAFHYHLGTVVGFFVAAAIGTGRLSSLGRSGRLALTLFASMAAVVALIGGVRMHSTPGTALEVDAAATKRALDVIPKDAPVAATLSLLPHLSQREEIYTLPEPFIPIEWGGSLTPGQLAGRAKHVRWAAYIRGDQVRRVTTREHPDLFPDVRETLLRDGFVVVARAGPLEVFERRGASG